MSLIQSADLENVNCDYYFMVSWFSRAVFIMPSHDIWFSPFSLVDFFLFFVTAAQ